VREGAPIILETPEQRQARYPQLAHIRADGGDGALVALALTHGRLVGGMVLRFSTPRTFREEDRALMLTLAAVCAQALERARLYDAERLARESAQKEIEERKRAAAALRDSEERYRRIVQTAAEGVWVIDAESRTTYTNGRMAEMLGCTAPEMLGRYPNDFLFEEDLEAARQEFRLKRQGDNRPFDFRLRRVDGSAIWVRVANRPLYKDDGQFVGVLGMFSDITQRKQLEQALQEADRRKDEFLATLGHEFRNPLASIRNAAQALNVLGPANPTVIQETTELIDRQVEHLSRLVDDLQDVSQIARGQLTLKLEPVELAEVVARAVEIGRPLIEARRHDLTVSLPSEPVHLEADLTRLAQIFGNLLSNAAKYTPESGHIWLTAERAESEAVFRVRDTGVGIPAEMLRRVFDPFTQLNRGLSHAEGGLGIGLTLVRSLVEMHGGTVQAVSGGPGQGSEFVVRLPMCHLRSWPQDESG
jgi:two-component system CheB/CheR fusion protein